jgi:hypothetical protein
MAKIVDDSVLDGALNIIKNNATQICVCSTQPTTYTEAITTYMLAKKSTLTSGDYTVADDAVSPYGRKVTVAQQSTISVTNGGSAQHVALCGAAATLYYVTTCTAQTLVSGNTVTIPAWKIQIGDPT